MHSKSEESQFTLKKQTIQSLPSSEVLIINGVVSKLSHLHHFFTDSAKLYESTATTILKWGSNFQSSFVKEAKSNMQKIKEELLKVLELIMEDAEKWTYEEFSKNWQKFMEINFAQKRISQSDIKQYKDAPSSAIATHILEHTFQQLQTIKQQFCQQIQQKNEKINELEEYIKSLKEQMINIQNKYDELQEDLEQEKKTNQVQILSSQLIEMKQFIEEQGREKNSLEERVEELFYKVNETEKQKEVVKKQCTRLKIKIDSLRSIIEEQNHFLKTKKNEESSKKEGYHRVLKNVSPIKNIQNQSDNTKQCKCKATSIVRQFALILRENYPAILTPKRERKTGLKQTNSFMTFF